MKKIILPSIIISFLLFSCQSKGLQNSEKKNIKATETTTETIVVNAANSLDWAGKYEGVLPCADCEGIK